MPETNVKVSVDANDLGKLQNGVNGANASIGALTRAMNGDFVGAMQQGAAGVRQLWKSVAAVPAGGPIVALAAVVVAGIKLWEHAAEKALEKTEKMVAAFKAAQAVFHASMGWNLTPAGRAERGVADVSPAGRSDAARAALDDALRIRTAAREEAARANAEADTPVMKTVRQQTGAAGASGLEPTYKNVSVVDEEATAARGRRRDAAAVALKEADETVAKIGEIYQDLASKERALAADRQQTWMETWQKETQALRSALSERQSAEQKSNEAGLSKRQLARQRELEAGQLAREMQTSPYDAVRFQKLNAMAAQKEREAKDLRLQADEEEKRAKAEASRKAGEAAREQRELGRTVFGGVRDRSAPDAAIAMTEKRIAALRAELQKAPADQRNEIRGELAGESFKLFDLKKERREKRDQDKADAAKVQEVDYSSVLEGAIGAGTFSKGGMKQADSPWARQFRGRLGAGFDKHLLPSAMGGPAGAAAHATQPVARTPEQQTLNDIQVGIEETNRILKDRLGLRP